MKRNLTTQKYLYLTYFILAIISILYTLWFMTDFQDLFGFKHRLNIGVKEFYELQLQTFNRTILTFSIILIIGVILMKMLEITKTIPNLFALIIDISFLVLTVIKSVSYIFKLISINNEFTDLDLSHVHLEGLEHFQKTSRTFYFGVGLYGCLGIIAFILTIVLIINFLCYLKRHEGVKQYFGNIKKEVLLSFNHFKSLIRKEKKYER